MGVVLSRPFARAFCASLWRPCSGAIAEPATSVTAGVAYQLAVTKRHNFDQQWSRHVFLGGDLRTDVCTCLSEVTYVQMCTVCCSADPSGGYLPVIASADRFEADLLIQNRCT